MAKVLFQIRLLLKSSLIRNCNVWSGLSVPILRIFMVHALLIVSFCGCHRGKMFIIASLGNPEMPSSAPVNQVVFLWVLQFSPTSD